jgi:hypothetical protein
MAEDKKLLVEDDEDLKDEKGTEYVAVDKPTRDENFDEDDDDDEDSLKSNSDDDNDDDREAIRERRRQEKKDRKERRDKAIGRDKIELNYLRDRNDELERRMMAVEQFSHQTIISDYDRELNVAINDAQTAEKIIAKAVEAGNGEDVAKAMRFREQAVSRAQQLAQVKQQAEYSAQLPRQQTPPPVNTDLIKHAQDFLNSNTWYDPQGRDEDSAVVLTIDAKLAQEGYDPTTEEYWDELRERVQRRLPEKFTKRKSTGGPAVGSGREHAPSSTRKEIYISPERKSAMQEAGVWDDPVLRQRYIKRYAEYDKMHKN